jgi:hypothetical protein
MKEPPETVTMIAVVTVIATVADFEGSVTDVAVTVTLRLVEGRAVGAS